VVSEDAGSVVGHGRRRSRAYTRVAVVLVTLVAAAAALAPAAQADPVIAAAGDIACGTQNALGPTSCREMATSDILVGLENAGNLAAVLPLGDTQYECAELSNYNLNDGTRRGYGRSWGRVKPLTHPAIGNHEYRWTGTYSTCLAEQNDDGAPGYFGYFGFAASPLDGSPSAPCTAGCKGYYSYDIGSWHLIALNSNCSAPGVSCSAGKSQETWLKNDLAQVPVSSCVLAYMHHPRFSSGVQSSSSLQPMWQDLYDAGADVVVTGHEHFYERFARLGRTGHSSDKYEPVPDPDGVREFVVGTGGKNHHSFSTIRSGSEVRNNDTYGVLKLTLHPDSYDWEFIPEAGKTFSDSGSDTCNDTRGGDTEAPTAPSGLSATASSSSQVDLSWTAATDNVGVTAYDIYRDGTLLKSVGNVTTASDTTTTASTTYVYTVKARDAGGNTSPASNAATVTTPAEGTTILTLAPTADTTAREASPSSNFGGATILEADSGSGAAKDAYLKFSVAGVTGTVQSAKLRLRTTTASNAGTSNGPAAYTTDTGWTEMGLTWSMRPAVTSGATDDKGALAANTWVEWNVTPLVSGDRTYSFRLATTSTDSVIFHSKEATAAANRPQLVVTFAGGGGGGDTEAPSAPSGFTATAVSSSQIDLSWNESTDNVGVTGYRLSRKGPSDPDFVQIATPTGTSYSDTGLSPSTTYQYQLVAVDAAGNTSTPPSTASATTQDPPPPVGGIEFVRDQVATVTSAATSLNVPTSSTAGNALVASIALHTGASNSVTSVTDSAGNTWTKGPVGFRSGSFTRIELWYALAALPVTQVTVRLASSSLVGANVSEWSGVAIAAALDGSASVGNPSSNAGSTPSLATNPGDLVLGGLNTSQAVTTTLATAGFTPLTNFGNLAGENGRAAYRIVTDTGPYSVRWTFSANASSGAAILALKPG
jgi:chitodextrinase